MWKQVIVVNKSLNMSPGKLSAMVAHGSISFLTHWLQRNVSEEYNKETGCYYLKEGTEFNHSLYANWITGSFTKIILEVENDKCMERIIELAHLEGLTNGYDFFNIVDDSTEFLDVPKWAVIAFAPMPNEIIDRVTGTLNLYGHNAEEIKRWEEIANK